jgi:hypothetical protein
MYIYTIIVLYFCCAIIGINIVNRFTAWNMDNLELHNDYGPICLVTNQIIQQLSKDWTFFGNLL